MPVNPPKACPARGTIIRPVDYTISEFGSNRRLGYGEVDQPHEYRYRGMSGTGLGRVYYCIFCLEEVEK